MTNEEFAEQSRHSTEHHEFADSHLAHAMEHRATLGNSMARAVVTWHQHQSRASVESYYLTEVVKAHLGYMESIANSLLAIATEMRLARAERR